jgi:CubicO group peptidase (beta-lactamase class C family)
MRWFVLGTKALAGFFALLVLATCIYLFVAPPDLLRVATNYSAKMVCSNVFLAGRDPVEVQDIDVQAGGHPILGYISIDIDEPSGVVVARLLGLFATGTAVYREGLGCASAPNGDIARLKSISLANQNIEQFTRTSKWPMGAHNLKMDNILANEELIGPGMRAVVVIKDAELIAETYGPGFDIETPLLGWSMTKTVTALIMGAVLGEDFNVESDNLFPQWQDDERRAIRIQDLMSMSSGLQWNEGYGSVSDVTRMLYLEPDMAAFGASLPLAKEGETASFHYSSGTTVLLSRIWQNLIGNKALSFPHEKLFGPLGMRSATLETDAAGTFAGSSYLYASARDWARLGQLILDGGQWNAQQLIDTDYINWMTGAAQSSTASWGRPEYGNGQIWLHGPDAGVPEGEDPDAGFDLPSDIRWMLGHDGQSIAIIPSEGLVVVRMGLTPSGLGYRPQEMVSQIIKSLKE